MAISATALAAVFWVVFRILTILQVPADGGPGPADCIVVLSAPLTDDGVLSDMYMKRVQRACELYKAGLAPCVVLTGGNGPGASEYAGRELIKLGVPDKAIITELQSLSTLQHTRMLKPVFEEHGFNSMILVTTDFHWPRAHRLFSRTGYRNIGNGAVRDRAFKGRMFWLARELCLWAAVDIMGLPGVFSRVP